MKETNFISVNGIESSIHKLDFWIRGMGFVGYDPYDTLNSFIPFIRMGKLCAATAIQFQKVNPVNIRPIIGISKEHNPKGIGLLLKSYCLLYQETKSDIYLETAEYLFYWLLNNIETTGNHYSWGYNFDWATPSSYLPKNTPSAVVTSFVIDGIYQYYMLSNDARALNAITESARWVCTSIPITHHETGISFAYTAQSTGACYNASLLAAEILAKADRVSQTTNYEALITKAIDFVLSKQRHNGEWWYSFDPISKKENKQIDFHQGFILVSLNNLNSLLSNPRTDVSQAISKGLSYYRNYQFEECGKSLWRIPRKWPVDIHNQSQGIITFCELCNFNDEYMSFSQRIASWTIKYMQDEKGFFYYRLYRNYQIKIPYMRWSQAWMLLALATLKNVQIKERL